jgi:hypothetical protein
VCIRVVAARAAPLPRDRSRRIYGARRREEAVVPSHFLFYIPESKSTAAMPRNSRENIMQSTIKELRHALQKLISATANANTNKALEARQVAYAAYRNSFNADERERIVKEAQHKQKLAPEGHFLHGIDPIQSYDEALKTFGNMLIYEVLGDDA